MAKGGPQPGSGRPKGSTNRPQIRGYFTQKEIDDLVALAKERAKTNDKVLVHVMEQIFGKAAQPIEGRVDLNIIDEEARAKGNKAIGEILSSGYIK
jgi:hypothetical protein